MARRWTRGEAVPWFRAHISGRGDGSSLDYFGGRAVLMLFLGKKEWSTSAPALELFQAHKHLFDGVRANLVGITLDPDDLGWRLRGMANEGDYWFHDSEGRIARDYGAILGEGAEERYAPFWLLLDIRLRVLETAPIGEGQSIFEALEAYLATAEHEAIGPAPVLIVPDVLEPELCARLIETYQENGGTPTGFYKVAGGVTSHEIDEKVKRRSDYYISDADLRRSLGTRIQRRLFPLVERAFNFRPTRIERFNVVCYDGDEGGFFKRHRDDTTPASAHRRFACTINLNAGEYEGGELCFPEFGARTYRAPTGGAVVFSCSTMHEALPVLRGKRYALLPFLYDEEGARQLEAYKAGRAPSDASEQPEQAG
jgi:predicted 2-oxoglutarate/Fe(II)-dependent dioxygenase YbiX